MGRRIGERGNSKKFAKSYPNAIACRQRKLDAGLTFCAPP
jgi:hypothetical protein